MVRRHPLERRRQLLGAGDRSVSERTPSRTSNLDSPAPFFLSERLLATHVPTPVSLGPIGMSIRVVGTNISSQPPEPQARPGEFKPQNCQAHRDQDDRRTWRDNHDHADCKDCKAYNQHRDSTHQPNGKIDGLHLHKLLIWCCPQIIMRPVQG